MNLISRASKHICYPNLKTVWTYLPVYISELSLEGGAWAIATDSWFYSMGTAWFHHTLIP